MLRNDISNKTAPIVAFNIDNILFKPKEFGLFDKALSLFSFDRDKYFYFEREVNYTNIDVINRVWARNEVSIYLVTFTDYMDDLNDFLSANEVSYTKLKKINGIDNLQRQCMFSFYYYFDTDLDIINKLSQNNAKDFYSIFSLLKV